MTMTCPHCQSQRVATKDIAKKTGGVLGMVGGAASGTVGTLGGAELGATVGMIAGPAGVLIGGLAGAFFGALVGGAAGCVAGSKLGEVVDDNILDNYECLDCGHVFSLPD
jgi:hypothetical protein